MVLLLIEIVSDLMFVRCNKPLAPNSILSLWKAQLNRSSYEMIFVWLDLSFMHTSGNVTPTICLLP